jgi:peptide/nickel transport system permease protein
MARSSGSLRAYALTRLALVLPMVLILLTLVFVLMRVAPGDPIQAALGGRLSPAELAARRAAAGCNRPLIAPYGSYLGHVFTGNFGTTITDNRPLTQVIAQNGAATLELTIAAVIVALIVGVPLGMLAGRLRDTPLDVGARLFGIVIYAAPVFFLGLIAQLVFGKDLNWLPTSGQASPLVQATLTPHTNLLIIDAIIDRDWSALSDLIKHLVLPAVVLGLVTAGVFLRLVRVNLIQTMKGDYVEAARARGVPERHVVVRHAFRNALVPIVTIMGLQVALLLSGAVLTEETFNWPGIGNQLISYLNNRDYIAVQGIITVFALVVVVVSLLIDFVSALVDPRVRFS